MYWSLLSTLLPLASDDRITINLFRSILDMSGNAIDSLKDIGIGLGALFLLFVIFVNVSHILDGGKFQVKMLVPIVVFLCVCNFKLVAGPIVSLVTTVQEKTCTALKNSKTDMLKSAATKHGYTYNKQWEVGLFMLFIDMAEQRSKNPVEITSEDPNPEETEEIEDSGGNQPANMESVKQEKKKGFKFLLGEVADGLVKGFRYVVETFIWQPLCNSKLMTYIAYGSMGLVATLMEKILHLFGVAMKGLGAVMSGVIVAFGPITFAFAVIPGNGKNILSWIIRLFQFTLYAPIVFLCDAFFTAVTMEMCNSMFTQVNGIQDATSGIFMLLGIMLGMLTILASVPTVAGMIIEGAVGSLGLTMGFNTATGMFSNLSNMTEPFRDKQMMGQMSGGGGGSSAASAVSTVASVATGGAVPPTGGSTGITGGMK